MYLNYENAWCILTGTAVAVADYRVAVAVIEAVPSAGYEVLEGVPEVLLGVVQRVPCPLFIRLRDELVDSAIDALPEVVPGSWGCELEMDK